MHQGWKKRLNNFQWLSIQLMLQKHTGTLAENTTSPHLQALSGTSDCQTTAGTCFHSSLVGTWQNCIRDLANSLPAQRVGSQHPGHLLGTSELSIYSALICNLPILSSVVSVLLKMCFLNPFLHLNWINELIDIKYHPQWHN